MIAGKEETFVRCYKVSKEDGQSQSFEGPHLVSKPGKFSGSHTRVVLPNVWVGLGERIRGRHRFHSSSGLGIGKPSTINNAGNAHLSHSLLAEIQMVSISALQATAIGFRSLEGDKVCIAKGPSLGKMLPIHDGTI